MSLKYSLEKDGITQGLLATWLACRQKAKWYLTGYSSRYTSMGLVYGTIGHAVLEKAYTVVKNLHHLPSPSGIKMIIKNIEAEWHKENPRADKKAIEFVELSCLLAEATLPLYFEFWAQDTKKFKWQKLEDEFKIPYTTKDGRKTLIRGKRDGVFLNPSKLWLFETKFKSRLNEGDLVDTLPFDLQVMTYVWSLWKEKRVLPSGVLYNIVRRIELKPTLKESLPQFARRCVEDIIKRPSFYFIRMEISINRADLNKFEMELEDMIVDFMDWWQGKCGHYKSTGSCINKYGKCEYVSLCAGQRSSFFVMRNKVFRELSDY